RYFSDRVAVMSAVYITCVQLGTAIPPLVAVPAADALGWRWSIGMWALVAFAALLPSLALLRARRSGVEAEQVGDSVVSDTVSDTASGAASGATAGAADGGDVEVVGV